jgi:hypothetical protein
MFGLVQETAFFGNQRFLPPKPVPFKSLTPQNVVLDPWAPQFWPQKLGTDLTFDPTAASQNGGRVICETIGVGSNARRVPKIN